MSGIFVIPASGRYQFSLKVTNGGALFVDGVIHFMAIFLKIK